MKLQSIVILSSLSLLSLSARADSSPTCVWGNNVNTGSYDEICGVEDQGGGCFTGTNAKTGQNEEVCGVSPQAEIDE